MNFNHIETRTLRIIPKIGKRSTDHYFLQIKYLIAYFTNETIIYINKHIFEVTQAFIGKVIVFFVIQINIFRIQNKTNIPNEH